MSTAKSSSLHIRQQEDYPANIYLLKVNVRNTIKRTGVFINFEHMSHFFLVFLLLTLKK